MQRESLNKRQGSKAGKIRVRTGREKNVTASVECKREWGKENASSVLSAFGSKAIISDGLGVHKCIQYGQLPCFGRQYECRKVYKGFIATYEELFSKTR